jgi:hypothetical protein
MAMPTPVSYHTLKWWGSRLSLAAILVAISLTSSVKAGPQQNKHIVLPNPHLIGCKSSDCPQMLTDSPAEGAIYPWQVSLDFADGQVVGLTALYDQPTTMDEVKAAIDDRYDKWAFAAGSSEQIRLWRVESEKFVVQLCRNDDGMVQLIYLIFDVRHPLSEPVRKKLLERFDATQPSDFARKLLIDRITPQSH